MELVLSVKCFGYRECGKYDMFIYYSATGDVVKVVY